jgi:hypothetical protein
VNVKSRWKNHGQWQCMHHVPPITLPASSVRCWMVGCSLRPSDETRPEEVPEVEMTNVVAFNSGSEPCAYANCSNMAREGSKYCSRTCSNRNARKRHKERRVA